MADVWFYTLVSSILLLTSPALTIDTLFSFSDPISQFIDGNFSSNVYGSDTAWAIDFYATWCGHCQRFVPAWKNLSYEIKDWHRVVRVGAVACSDRINSQLCTRLNIWSYPTVKMFPVKSPLNSQGEQYRGSKSKLAEYLAEYVHKTHQNARPATWPNMKAARNLAEIRQEFTSGKTSAFIVFENSTDEDTKHVGKQVVLDLSSQDSVLVRRMYENNSASLGIRDYPSVHKLSSNGQLTLISSANNRKELSSAIKSSLKHTTMAAAATTPSMSTVPPTKIPQGLHMQDLESSLYYSLWLEVPRKRIIQGTALTALKNYLKLLAKYHPGRVEVRNFVKRLSRWTQRQTRPFSSARWTGRLNRIKAPNAFIPQRAVWTGCKGSQPKYRGYPCSLWMTFHALTVSAYLKDGDKSTFAPKDSLVAVREYIDNFFGCRHCAGHFMNMSANVEEEVSTKSGAVMWLWSRHNRVNNRLSEDLTEDPQNPKVQFPAGSACGYCRHGEQFNSTAVLSYLLNFYRASSIINDVLPYSTPAPKVRTPRTSTHISTRPVPTPTTAAACRRNESSWSACSLSCGTGVSQRYSNDNPDCVVRKQLRLCQTRPCGDVYPHGANCEDTFQTSGSAHIRYSHCYSGSKYQQKFCGNCTDKCCYPSTSTTRTIPFYCSTRDRWPPRRHRINVRLQWIDQCSCAATCPTEF